MQTKAVKPLHQQAFVFYLVYSKLSNWLKQSSQSEQTYLALFQPMRSKMCIFPRLASVTCFPALSAKRWLHVFGSSSSDDNWFWLFKPKQNAYTYTKLHFKSNGKYFSTYAIADWNIIVSCYHHILLKRAVSRKF